MFKPLLIPAMLILTAASSTTGNTVTSPPVSEMPSGLNCVIVGLEDGQPVPAKVAEVGSVCGPDGTAFGVSSVMCESMKRLYNVSQGWWTEGGVFHVGQVPGSVIDECDSAHVHP